MAVLPAALCAPFQHLWASSYRCPEAYKRIDQWCARTGHRQLVACLAYLYQQLRLATVAQVGRGNGEKFQTKALLAMVKSHHRHRSHSLKNRLDLLNRHLRILAALGLVERGRGWVRFVDVSELAPLQAPAIRLHPYNEESVVPERNGDLSRYEPSQKRRSLKILRPGRGSASAKQPRTGGRFAKKEQAEAGLAPPGRTQPAEVDVERSGPQAASPAPTPAKTAAREQRPQAAEAEPERRVSAAELRDLCSRHRALAALAKVSWVGSCYRFSSWRAGVRALVAMAPGAVRCPSAIVASVAGKVERGAVPDPLSKPGYFAHAGWGPRLLALADLPTRATSTANPRPF